MSQSFNEDQSSQLSFKTANQNTMIGDFNVPFSKKKLSLKVSNVSLTSALKESKTLQKFATNNNELNTAFLASEIIYEGPDQSKVLKGSFDNSKGKE